MLYYNINKIQQPPNERNTTMIKLHLSTLNSALNEFLPAKDFEVKSISAAWNKLREIRDLDVSTALLDGLLVTVDMGDLPISTRLPLEILFNLNTKGKIEFKDMQKIREKAMARMNAKDDEGEEDYPDQGEEYMEKDLALSAL
jgi:hypothetical protein